jgi:hypothetical protein
MLAMGKLYISARESTFIARDEGGEYADLDQARRQAIKGAASIAADDIENDGPRRTVVAQVEEESGRVVSRLAVTIAVDDLPPA